VRLLAFWNHARMGVYREALAAGVSQYGMQTFDQSLYSLLGQGLIDYDTALENASNPDDFKLKVQGIGNSTDTSHEEMGGYGR